MASPEDQTTSAATGSEEIPFRFLDLPGELRNQIYGYLLRSSPCLRMHPRDNLSTGRETESVNSTDSQASDDANSGHHMALTQVCKEIRDEFKPLLMAGLQIQILADNIPAYIAYMSACNFLTIPRKLDIVAAYHHRPDSPEYDLLPLLRLRNHREDLELAFKYDRRTLRVMKYLEATDFDKLNSLIKVRSPSIDAELNDGVFDRVILGIATDWHVQVHLDFNPNRIPQTVANQHQDLSDALDEAAYHYLHSIGIPALDTQNQSDPSFAITYLNVF